MPFYVHAQDRPGVGPRLYDLAEEHWSYMDRFADRLVLRGPTLSADGIEHTGSVHVVDLPDRASAERFAAEEPYWLAGLYREVRTVRVVVLVNREPATGSRTSDLPQALVAGRWTAKPGATGAGDLHRFGVHPESRVRFVAVLVDDDRSRMTGILSIIEATSGEALPIIQPFADQLAGEPVALTAQRWTRGGRS